MVNTSNTHDDGVKLAIKREISCARSRSNKICLADEFGVEVLNK